MGPFGSGLHDELVRVRQQEFQDEACKGFLASRARQERREAPEKALRRSGSVRLAEALRAAADRLDRSAADCQ